MATIDRITVRYGELVTNRSDYSNKKLEVELSATLQKGESEEIVYRRLRNTVINTVRNDLGISSKEQDLSGDFFIPPQKDLGLISKRRLARKKV